MAMNRKVQFEGAIHHVAVRSDDRRNLFVHHKERRRFMERLVKEGESAGS